MRAPLSSARALAFIAWCGLALPAPAQTASAAASTCDTQPGHSITRTPCSPYPLAAAGWGPQLGPGQMASRWAEAWLPRAPGAPAALKAIALGGLGMLSLNTEFRLRQTSTDASVSQRGEHWQQTQARAMFGAHLQVDPHWRLYAELGSGQVAGQRDRAGANLVNRWSLQQLFVDVHRGTGDTLLGVMLGRQEFADGPRQLLSLSDGPNLHRSWNGLRLYAQRQDVRLGLFDLRATRLGAGGFDETVDAGETLRGINGSLRFASTPQASLFLDPFWIRSTQPQYRLAGRAGPDRRQTTGARLWGQRGRLQFDWTAAVQRGRHASARTIDAWGLFLLQSWALSERGWRPRLSARLDLASGGGSYGSGVAHTFNPLYASSDYLGEGQQLGLSNLHLLSAGLRFTPGSRTTLTLEHGRAERLHEGDAAYAGGARPYAGTERLGGRHIGDLSRLGASWTITPQLSLRFRLEHLAAGELLRTAGVPSSTYSYLDLTYRY